MLLPGPHPKESLLVCLGTARPPLILHRQVEDETWRGKEMEERG